MNVIAMRGHSRNQPIKRLGVWRVHTFTVTVRPKLTAQTNKAIFTVCVWGRKNGGTDKQNPFPLMFILRYLIQSSFRTQINHCRSFCFWVITQCVTFRESWKEVHVVRKSWMKILECNLNNCSRSMLLKSSWNFKEVQIIRDLLKWNVRLV